MEGDLEDAGLSDQTAAPLEEKIFWYPPKSH
jgi:hypothetical protein